MSRTKAYIDQIFQKEKSLESYGTKTRISVFFCAQLRASSRNLLFALDDVDDDVFGNRLVVTVMDADEDVRAWESVDGGFICGSGIGIGASFFLFANKLVDCVFAAAGDKSNVIRGLGFDSFSTYWMSSSVKDLFSCSCLFGPPWFDFGPLASGLNMLDSHFLVESLLADCSICS
jgi:hypothetical protein